MARTFALVDVFCGPEGGFFLGAFFYVFYLGTLGWLPVVDCLVVLLFRKEDLPIREGEIMENLSEGVLCKLLS